MTSGMSYIEIAVGSRNWAPWLCGHSELGAAASRKAVWWPWWDLLLASLLVEIAVEI